MPPAIDYVPPLFERMMHVLWFTSCLQYERVSARAKAILMTDEIWFFKLFTERIYFIVKISHSSPCVKVEPLKVTLAETYCINITALAGCFDLMICIRPRSCTLTVIRTVLLFFHV